MFHSCFIIAVTAYVAVLSSSFLFFFFLNEHRSSSHSLIWPSVITTALNRPSPSGTLRDLRPPILTHNRRIILRAVFFFVLLFFLYTVKRLNALQICASLQVRELHAKVWEQCLCGVCVLWCVCSFWEPNHPWFWPCRMDQHLSYAHIWEREKKRKKRKKLFFCWVLRLSLTLGPGLC